MEEMRNAALAYYANLTDQQKQLAGEFFQKMDTDGDGKISVSEYIESQSSQFHDALGAFKDVDRDGNETLDYEEFITFYYMVKSGKFVYCKSCGVHLKGLYFTCVPCFDGGIVSYDLCCACFGDKKHKQQHEHEVFCDTHTLLMSKSKAINKLGSKMNVFRAREIDYSSSAPLHGLLEAFETTVAVGNKAVEAGAAVGNIVSAATSGCATM